MNNIDVFCDIEGICCPRGASGFSKFDSLVQAVPSALADRGYEITSFQVFACKRTKDWSASLELQKAWSQVMGKNNGKMVWSSSIADTALIDTAYRMLSSGKLSKTIFLIAMDHDFVPLVRELRNSGRVVFVSGPQVSDRLRVAANVYFKFRKFLRQPVDFSPYLRRGDAFPS